MSLKCFVQKIGLRANPLTPPPSETGKSTYSVRIILA